MTMRMMCGKCGAELDVFDLKAHKCGKTEVEVLKERIAELELQLSVEQYLHKKLATGKGESDE